MTFVHSPDVSYTVNHAELVIIGLTGAEVAEDVEEIQEPCTSSTARKRRAAKPRGKRLQSAHDLYA